MRKVFKTLSSELVEFVPSNHKNDTDLTRDAKEISKRPMILKVRKLTREDKYNLRGELITDTREGGDGEKTSVVVNIGTVARYVWENCVAEVHNVLLESEEFEVVRGEAKNSLFNSEGMDQEIMETVQFIQEISSLSEPEVKN